MSYSWIYITKYVFLYYGVFVFVHIWYKCVLHCYLLPHCDVNTTPPTLVGTSESKGSRQHQSIIFKYHFTPLPDLLTTGRSIFFKYDLIPPSLTFWNFVQRFFFFEISVVRTNLKLVRANKGGVTDIPSYCVAKASKELLLGKLYWKPLSSMTQPKILIHHPTFH